MGGEANQAHGGSEGLFTGRGPGAVGDDGPAPQRSAGIARCASERLRDGFALCSTPWTRRSLP